MPTGNTQQIIDYGAAANDGQGDPLRTAFIKTDENFDNIWLAGPVGSNVRITNNTIGVLDTNGNLILSPNGIGVIQTNNHVVPRLDRTYDLGTANLKYRTVYANTATFQALTLNSDLTVGGNLTVSGNIIEMGNIVTDALTLQLANTAANSTAANGAGITVGANDNIATFLYNSTSNSWVTNLAVTYANGQPVGGNTGNIGFDDNNIYNTNGQGVVISNFSFIAEAETAYVQIPAGNSPSDLSIVQEQGNVRIAANAAAWTFDTNGILNVPLTAYGASTEIKYGLGNLVSYLDGQWTIGEYNGNNFGTTGIRVSPGVEGNAELVLPADQLANVDATRLTNYAGNVIVVTGNNHEYKFDNQGNLTVPGNIITPTNFVGTSLRTNLTDFNWSEAITGITLGATTTITLANNVFGDPWTGQVTITDVTGTTEANATWWYEAVDSNQFILYTDSTLSTLVDSSAWGAYVSGGFAVTLDYGNIEINAQNITIRSDHGDYNNRIWRFNQSGQTVFPYQDVVRGDVQNGNITGYAMVIGDGTSEAIISTPNATSYNAQRLVINPGKGQDGTGGEGGDIYLWAGRGGDTDGNGGDVKIRGGYGPGNGQGGYIRIEAGDVQGTGNPGYSLVKGGDHNGGTGGYVQLEGGYGGNGNGGYVTIQGGYGTGNGGDVGIYGGVSGQGVAYYGNVLIDSGSATWTFDNTGNLTLPTNSFNVNYANGTQVSLGGGGGNTGNVTFNDQVVQGTGDENGGGGLYLAPGTNSTGNLQYLRVRGGDYPTHIHLDTGNNNYFDQYFGADFRYVKLEANGNILINADDDNGKSATWTFDYNGNLTAPGNISVTGNVTAGNFIGGGSNVELVAGSYTFTFDNTGVLTLPTIGGDEGGELHLGIPAANTTLQNSVKIDVYQDRLRFFEGSANAKGAYLDLANCPSSVSAAIGYRDIPQISFSANATATGNAAGCHYYSTTAGNLALTLPDNSSVAFPTGATLTIVVNAAGNVLVNQGSGVSLYQAGASTTGNRVVGAYGLATVMKVAANTWVISGTGVY